MRKSQEEERCGPAPQACHRGQMLGQKLMWNGTLGLLTSGIRDTVRGGWGTNRDQRSVVYVMLARKTRRPMTDLEGGAWGSLRGSNHRITLLLSTFNSISA